MLLDFDGSQFPYALGLEFDETEGQPDSLKRSLRYLSDSAYDTIGSKFQDRPEFAIYRGAKLDG